MFSLFALGLCALSPLPKVQASFFPKALLSVQKASQSFKKVTRKLPKSFGLTPFVTLEGGLGLHLGAFQRENALEIYSGCFIPGHADRKALRELQLATMKKQEQEALEAGDIPIEFLREKFQKMKDENIGADKNLADYGRGWAGIWFLDTLEEYKKIGWRNDRSAMMRHQVINDFDQVFEMQFKRLDPVTPGRNSEDFNVQETRKWIMAIATLSYFMEETNALTQAHNDDFHAMNDFLVNPKKSLIVKMRDIESLFERTYREHLDALKNPESSKEEKKQTLDQVLDNLIKVQSIRSAMVLIFNHSIRELKKVSLQLRARRRVQQDFYDNRVWVILSEMSDLEDYVRAAPAAGVWVHPDLRKLSDHFRYDHPERDRFEKLRKKGMLMPVTLKYNFQFIDAIRQALEDKYEPLEKRALEEGYHPCPKWI